MPPRPGTGPVATVRNRVTDLDTSTWPPSKEEIVIAIASIKP